jgi:hypothetical protein
MTLRICSAPGCSIKTLSPYCIDHDEGPSCDAADEVHVPPPELEREEHVQPPL